MIRWTFSKKQTKQVLVGTPVVPAYVEWEHEQVVVGDVAVLELRQVSEGSRQPGKIIVSYIEMPEVAHQAQVVWQVGQLYAVYLQPDQADQVDQVVRQAPQTVVVMTGHNRRPVAES